VYYAYSPIRPIFCCKFTNKCENKNKNKMFCHLFLVFLGKFFKFKNYNYNHIFTSIFFGGLEGRGPLGRKRGSGLSIFLHDVMHPNKLQGLVLHGNATF
jgi:hypothetical protein